MGFRGVEDPESREAILQRKLEAPGGVEGFVNSGRVPHFQPFRTGKLPYDNNIEGVICYVPPEGTQFGDTVTQAPYIGLRYTSPGGIERGEAYMLFLTPEEAAPLQQRTELARESLQE